MRSTSTNVRIASTSASMVTSKRLPAKSVEPGLALCSIRYGFDNRTQAAIWVRELAPILFRMLVT